MTTKRERDPALRSVAPPALRVERFEHEGKSMVVLSYPHGAEDSFDLPLETRRCLTRAQQEVAAHVLAGLSNKEIAEKRGTSVGTVAKQVETLYRRLEISSRRELAALVERVRSEPSSPE